MAKNKTKQEILQVKSYKIQDINPAKYNPRQISDAAYAGLKESIKKFGLTEFPVVNKRTNTLVSGHQRLKICEELGWSELPVVEVDLSLAEEKALNLTLNNKKIMGEYTDGVKLILDEIRLELGAEYTEDIMLDQIEVNLCEEVTENEKAEGELKGEVDYEFDKIIFVFSQKENFEMVSTLFNDCNSAEEKGEKLARLLQTLH